MLVATLLVSYRVAAALASDCLTLEETVPRAEIGDAFTNADEIIANAYEDSRLMNFTVCVDKYNILTGIQLKLWSEE